MMVFDLIDPMTTLSQTRDAFQLRLLTFLYRGSTSSSLVLKGGAALRVLTESARFTQDLELVLGHPGGP